MVIQTLAIIIILAIATISFNIFDTFAQTAETWKEFNDPQNEFSMQYPSDWRLEIGNRFDLNDVLIYSPGGALDGFVSLQYFVLSNEIESLMDMYNKDQVDLEKMIKDLFPVYFRQYSAALDQFYQVEKTDYNNYQIDGHAAASTIFSYEVSGVERVGWLVWTLIGGNTFNFALSAPQDRFEQIVPVAEKMLNSIKILDDENKLVDEYEEDE